MSDVIDMIRSKGYWDVVVRPQEYREDRVPYAQLDDTLIDATVRMRGWPVPFIDFRQQILRADTWIGQDIDGQVVGHYEAWRFYTSGQFNHLRGVGADWRHTAEVSPQSSPRDPVIEVWEILFYITEIFELASRLALSPAGGDSMTIEARLHGLAGRGLIVGQRNRAEFFQPYRATQDEMVQRCTLTKEQLLTAPRAHAVDMSLEFFARFGWKPAHDQIADHQRELDDRT